MEQHGLDAFPLVSGITAVVAGPLFLADGESTGWCLLLIAAGVVLVAFHQATAHHVDFDPIGRGAVIAVVLGLVCLWVAVIYLSRAADDLPRIFPGHSANSEHYRLLYGVTMVIAGTALITCAALGTRLVRAAERGGDKA
jgi:hypothetical protein